MVTHSLCTQSSSVVRWIMDTLLPPAGAVMSPWTACRPTHSGVFWPLHCPHGNGQPANPKQSPLCWEPVRGPSTQQGDPPGTTWQGPPSQRRLSLVREHACMFDRLWREHFSSDWARKVLSKTCWVGPLIKKIKAFAVYCHHYGFSYVFKGAVGTSWDMLRESRRMQNIFGLNDAKRCRLTPLAPCPPPNSVAFIRLWLTGKMESLKKSRTLIGQKFVRSLQL